MMNTFIVSQFIVYLQVDEQISESPHNKKAGGTMIMVSPANK